MLIPHLHKALNVACNAMTTEQLKELIENLKTKGVQFDDGLTEQEILQVEQKFNFNFPPDLKQFLKTSLPISKDFYDWRKALTSKDEADRINSMLAWTLDGMLFDIENNDYWFDGWGEKPKTLQEQFEIARRHHQTYPTLIPIFSHRYIPSDPNAEGNPVFSVYQMDIIYYGNDLATYFGNEFHFELSDKFEPLDKPKNKIKFWTRCVENN
jgi:hypothetical protein